MKATKLLKATASAFGLARKATDVEAIEAAIVEARALVAEGEAAEAEAQGRYRNALLADDGDPAAALADMQAAKIRRDRGEAQAAELTVRLAAVREGQEQDRRRALYVGAEARASAARVALTQSYPAIAREVHALLRTLAEAETAVAAANADLPDGATPLPSPEAEVRAPAWTRQDPVSVEEVELWVPLGRGDPLPPEDQARVRRAIGKHDWIGTLTRGDEPPMECHLRTFRRTVTRDLPSTTYVGNLAGGISLPALYPYTPPLWPQQVSLGQVGSREPGETLAALAEVEPLQSPSWRRPEAFREQVRYEEVARHHDVELVPLGNARSVGPAPDTRVRYGSDPRRVFGGR